MVDDVDVVFFSLSRAGCGSRRRSSRRPTTTSGSWRTFTGAAASAERWPFRATTRRAASSAASRWSTCCPRRSTGCSTRTARASRPTSSSAPVRTSSSSSSPSRASTRFVSHSLSFSVQVVFRTETRNGPFPFGNNTVVY